FGQRVGILQYCGAMATPNIESFKIRAVIKGDVQVRGDNIAYVDVVSQLLSIFVDYRWIAREEPLSEDAADSGVCVVWRLPRPLCNGVAQGCGRHTIRQSEP